MALDDIATSYSDRARLNAVPKEHRNAAFRAINPQMAALLDRAEAFPEQTGSLLKKLDATSAEEFVSRLTGHGALRAALADKRDGVQQRTFSRARELHLDLTKAQEAEVEAAKPSAQPRTVTVTRTQRTLSKPMDELVPALAKMATLDERDVIEWAAGLDETAPWEAILAAVHRHHGLSVRLLRQGLANQALDIDALWEKQGAHLLYATNGTEGELNLSHIKVYERALLDGYHIEAPSPDASSQEVLKYLATAPTMLRHMCGVASIEEVRAAIHAEINNTVDHAVISRVSGMFLNIRTAEMADALIEPLYRALETFGTQSWRMEQSVAKHLVGISGISRNTRRKCWALLTSGVTDIIRGEHGGEPDQDDLKWLVSNHGAETTSVFQLDTTLSRMHYIGVEDSIRSFFDRLLEEVPGTAAAALARATLWQNYWTVEAVMRRAASVIKDNEPAWKLFMEQVDGHSGTLDELALAAVIATQ